MAAVPHSFLYDVFLSFRGEDTRHGFTGNLFKALNENGVRTFMDDEELRKGDEITPSLLKAIEDSQIAIVVLSKKYADSSFCLEELSKILDSMKDKADRSVLPIFYKVDPSYIRKLQKSYGEAMAKHMANSNPNIDKWKASLHQVASLCGSHYKKGDMYEHEFIGKIVEEVLKKINLRMTIHVGDYLVGLETKIEHVISLLNVRSADTVHMVGIHGIGGIGKTTLALEVYNSIGHQFHCSCFVKVRENYHKNGLALQKILLSQIVGKNFNDININSVEEGIPKLQKILSKKKVLLLLDDVDNEKQLQAIAGKSNWFGLGSRVIITTRNQRLLTLHGIEAEHTYEMKELNDEDAFDLVKWNAFKNEKADNIFHIFENENGYVHVLERAVAYASGLPLALEVIGSHFSNRTIEECKCALDQCERVLDEKIQMTLQLSFDALKKEEKIVFLDIACCLKGYKLTTVEQILHAHHGYSIKNHINVLVEKSLIKISESGNVTLHDLLEDMGKGIVKQESPNPGERSRLWDYKDINEVLEENKETSKIGIIYVSGWNIKCEGGGKAFNKMKNLKTLLICDYEGGSFEHNLPNSLRVVDCCLSYFTIQMKFENMRVLNYDRISGTLNIHDLSNLPNLEEISIENSDCEFTIDKAVCFLSNLKILRIINCEYVVSFPPLDCPSLVELDLSNCSSLETFPLTVNGFVGNLKILRLINCEYVKSVPPLNCPSLVELDLSNCSRLESFPLMVNGFVGNLKILRLINCRYVKSVPPLNCPSLVELDLSDCYSLESFPLMVNGFVGNLKILRLKKCFEINIIPFIMLYSLEELNLEYCHSLESFSHVEDGLGDKLKAMSFRSCIKLKTIPPLNLASLEELDLSDCYSLENFPRVVDEFLGKLKTLLVTNCRNLKSIPPLKLDSLEKVDFSNCHLLESCPFVVDQFLGKLRTLRATNCHSLRSIPALKLDSLEELDISHCYFLESFPSDGLLDKLKFLNIEQCHMLRSLPPLRLTLLERFNLSYCPSLEWFPEILGEMINIPQLQFNGTTIQEQDLSFSFENVTQPETFCSCKCGIFNLPKRDTGLQMMAEISIEYRTNVSPMISSRVECICLVNCNVSLDYLSERLLLFANVKELHLTNNRFMVLPKSIKECKFLLRLFLDDCKELQEIQEIPPSLKILSALNCQALTSSSKTILLNQKLHEAGNTWFRLPRAKIPEWFDHQFPAGLSISFWFRNKFPTIILCVVSPLEWISGRPARVIINDNTFFITHGVNVYQRPQITYHLNIFHMQLKNFNDKIDDAVLENKWNYAEVDFGFPFMYSGIHVLKDKSSMEDIQFTNPEIELY